MNKIAKLFVIAGVTFVLACGSKGPATDAAAEQARLDSIKAAEAAAATTTPAVEGAVDAATTAVGDAAKATGEAAKDGAAKAVEAGAKAVEAGAEKAKEAVKK